MIKTFSVSGFKSLINVTVDLGPVTVLIGRSGSGKSNFVQSLRYLRNYLFFRDSGRAHPGGKQAVAPAFKPELPLEFEVTFSVDGVPGDFQYRLKVSKQEGGISESLSLADQPIFDYQVDTWRIKPDGVSLPRANSPVLGQLPSVPEAVIAFTALTTGVGCYEFPLGVLMAHHGSNGVPGLQDDGGNFLDVLGVISRNLRDLNVRKGIVASLATLNPTVSALELDPILDPKNVVITHQFNGSRVPMSLAQESEGFRRFLAHLLAIYQEPPKQLLIFEEPENGIYPGALELLAEELTSAPASGRGQVILTTHSPGMLDCFDVDSLRVVELVGHSTRIGRIASYQLDSVREGLLTSGELLTVDTPQIAEP